MLRTRCASANFGVMRGRPQWPHCRCPTSAQATADAGTTTGVESDSSLDEADRMDGGLLSSLDESLLARGDVGGQARGSAERLPSPADPA